MPTGAATMVVDAAEYVRYGFRCRRTRPWSLWLKLPKAFFELILV
jgi:hypothetical protein